MAMMTSKRLFFISGDVGGARALLPVIQECDKDAIPFWVAANGHMAREARQHWPLIEIPRGCDVNGVERCLTVLRVGVLVFASSVHDTLPLTAARQARKLGIPVVHVLDNWTGYRRRLENDGLPMLLPEVYTVMDELAQESAAAEGIDPAALLVTGHPALASLAWEEPSIRGSAEPFAPVTQLLFVSEPAAADQGSSVDSPTFRGYVETQVLGLLCEALQPYAEEVNLRVLPHPRENAEQLERHFRRVKGKLQGSVLKNGRGCDHLLDSAGVAGMASLLLYEAWLHGKPVLSLQPDLLRDDLRMLARRDGVRFLVDANETDSAVAEWLAAARNHRDSSRPHPDLMRHRLAARQIAAILQEQLSAGGCSARLTV